MKKQTKPTKQTEQKPRREVWIYLGWDAQLATGEALFGADDNKWKYVCPCCGNIQSPQDMPYKSEEDLTFYALVDCTRCAFSLSGKVPVKNPSTEQLLLLKKPHGARVLSIYNGVEYDAPIFDFYRPAETGSEPVLRE